MCCFCSYALFYFFASLAIKYSHSNLILMCVKWVMPHVVVWQWPGCCCQEGEAQAPGQDPSRCQQDHHTGLGTRSREKAHHDPSKKEREPIQSLCVSAHYFYIISFFARAIYPNDFDWVYFSLMISYLSGTKYQKQIHSD